MFAFIEKIAMPPLGSRKSFTPIEEAKCIGNVETYMAQTEFHSDVQTALNLQNTFYRRYSVQAWKMEKQKTMAIVRLEEAKTNLKLVDKFMRQPGKEHQNMMQVADDVYRWVTILPVKKVSLQVDKNSPLHVEFSLPEAMEVIKKNITKQQEQRLKIEHDLDYLEDQVNLTQLNMAVLRKYGMAKMKNARSLRN